MFHIKNTFIFFEKITISRNDNKTNMLPRDQPPTDINSTGVRPRCAVTWPNACSDKTAVETSWRALFIIHIKYNRSRLSRFTFFKANFFLFYFCPPTSKTSNYHNNGYSTAAQYARCAQIKRTVYKYINCIYRYFNSIFVHCTKCVRLLFVCILETVSMLQDVFLNSIGRTEVKRVVLM